MFRILPVQKQIAKAPKCRLPKPLVIRFLKQFEASQHQRFEMVIGAQHFDLHQQQHCDFDKINEQRVTYILRICSQSPRYIESQFLVQSAGLTAAVLVWFFVVCSCTHVLTSSWRFSFFSFFSLVSSALMWLECSTLLFWNLESFSRTEFCAIKAIMQLQMKTH